MPIYPRVLVYQDLIYTLNLGLKIAVFVRKRKQSRFKEDNEGVRESAERALGEMGEHRGSKE